MITTVCLDSSAKKFMEDCPTADISELRLPTQNVVWADVSDPTSEDFLELAEEFGFHPLSIEDCRNEHQRPKVEEYNGYYFIVLYEAELVGPQDRLELRELISSSARTTLSRFTAVPSEPSRPRVACGTNGQTARNTARGCSPTF